MLSYYKTYIYKSSIPPIFSHYKMYSPLPLIDALSSVPNLHARWTRVHASVAALTVRTPPIESGVPGHTVAPTAICSAGENHSSVYIASIIYQVPYSE